MKLLKFFVAISLVADTLGSDHYQEKQIQKFLEKNVKKVTRNLGWELLFAAGETNQNKGFYIGYMRNNNLCTPFKHDFRCSSLCGVDFVFKREKRAQRRSCLKGSQRLYS